MVVNMRGKEAWQRGIGQYCSGWVRKQGIKKEIIYRLIGHLRGNPWGYLKVGNTRHFHKGIRRANEAAGAFCFFKLSIAIQGYA